MPQIVTILVDLCENGLECTSYTYLLSQFISSVSNNNMYLQLYNRSYLKYMYGLLIDTSLNI